jgi:sporulation protein YlmC with PRC-barrel domain
MRTTWNLAIALFAMAALWAPANTARGDDKDQVRVAVTHVFRTADIVGLAVKNKAGENIGKIDDLAIDMKSGDVHYAALAYGGVAGVGSKLFAVPLQKMTFVMGEPNNRNSRHFVFDVSKDELDKSNGFDTSHWPNVADPKWSAGIERKPQASGEQRPAVAYETVFRASKIKGMDVRNDEDQNLGSVDDLVIDIPKAHVKYVALSFGSWFTGGNKLFAVPLGEFTLTHRNDKTFLTLHHSQEALKNAPGFDKNHWPDTADPNWGKEIDSYFERTASRRTTARQ